VQISLPNIPVVKAKIHIEDIHRSVHVFLFWKMHVVPCVVHVHDTAPFLLRATSLQCAEFVLRVHINANFLK